MKNDDPWWDMNLSRFPKGYTACNMLRSERIPPLPQEVRDRLVERYCPPESTAMIKSNDADRDCLVRIYLGRRKIQNQLRKGRNFFSLRNYPLHLNQAEDLNMQIKDYARAMAEALAMMHWTAKIDANDIEFVLGGTQKSGSGEHFNSFNNDFFGIHGLWILDFDCCKPLTMDEAGVQQATRAFQRNDPYFPYPSAPGSTAHILWQEFRSRYLECSQDRIGGERLKLPEQFLALVEDSHRQAKT